MRAAASINGAVEAAIAWPKGVAGANGESEEARVAINNH